MTMMLRSTLALLLALPAPAIAQVASIPALQAPIGTPVAGEGFRGDGGRYRAPLPGSGLPTLRTPVAAGRAVAASIAPKALPGEAAKAKLREKAVTLRMNLRERPETQPGTFEMLLKKRKASPIMEYRKKRQGGWNGGLEGAKADLDAIFDGLKGHKSSILADEVYDRYDPEIYSDAHIADSRYSEMLARSWVLMGTPRSRLTSNKAQVRLRSQNALLERVRVKDQNTYSHSIRVGLLSGLLAMQMGFSHVFAGRLTWAAAFHDVGKLNASILKLINKKGKLTDEERKIINGHPAYGARKLLSLYGLPKSLRLLAARVALNHHERKDGKGYPRGLKDDEIPLESRIIAVADVFDALMENRPYRAGMSWEEAFEIMEKEAKGFDSEVWDAFVDMTRALLGPLLPDPGAEMRLAA
ncbi:HD-GYP domain-containing protein [Elusimicrobiota bacterium]